MKPIEEEIAEIPDEALAALRTAHATALGSASTGIQQTGWNIQGVILDVQGIRDDVRDSGGGDQ